MLSCFKNLLAAFRMLTRLRLPGPETRAEDIVGALAFFPVVGAFVGLFIAGLFRVGLEVWEAPVAAVVAIAIGLLLTGGFHEDGASDAADGLGSAWTRQRALEIMKDSRLGAYGAMALWAVLTLRWAALVALDHHALWAMPLAMALGRWSLGAFMLILKPVSRGLASQMDQGGKPLPFVASTLFMGLFLGAAWWAGVSHLLGAFLAACVATGTWAAYLRQEMGGYSGDLLGAGNQIVEAAVLLVLVSR